MRVRVLGYLLAACCLIVIALRQFQQVPNVDGSRQFEYTRKYTVSAAATEAAEAGKVPPILHQMWKTPSVPMKYEAWSETWTKLMPGLRRKFYSDADLPAIVRKYTPQFYDQWSNFSRPIEKADFARYVLLYGEGGIYADLDVELLKPIDSFCDGLASVLLPLELKCELTAAKHFWQNRGRLARAFLGQSIMLSVKGDAVWLELMQYLTQNYQHDGYETFNTGPDGVTNFFNEHPHACKKHSVRAVLGLIDGPFAVHHGTGSWRTSDSLLRKRKLMAKTSSEGGKEFVGLTAVC